MLLLLRRSLRPLLLLRLALLRSLFRTLSRPPAPLWTLAALAPLALFAAAAGLARPLFELAHFGVHVAPRLALLALARLVVAAVRAPLPPLGIGLLTGSAKDAFRQRHGEIGAHCTLRPLTESHIDEDRRRTLRALIELAEENTPSACWNDQRAVELLRAQSTPDELRELGVDERMIEYVFVERHAR